MRGLAVILCGLAFALAVATFSHAQLPKEGTYTGTHTYAGTILKSLKMGEERAHYTYEILGVMLIDSGDGLLHNASSRCLGSGHTIKGVYEDSGVCEFIRPDRDQVFATYQVSGKLGEGNTWTLTFVGGTGKLAGITGGGESTGTSLRRTSADAFHFHAKVKMSYKLP